MKNERGASFWAVAVIFIAALIGFGASFLKAVRVDADPGRDRAGGSGEAPTMSEPEAPVVEEESEPTGTPPGVQYPRVTDSELLDAVNQDLFQPGRTPPLERYRFPSERATSLQASRDDRRRREPNLRIVGTALAGELGIALVQLADSIPFAVVLGETVDGYLVASIYEEGVTLTRDDALFDLPVVEPERGSSSGGRDRSGREQRAIEDAARALQERVQQMIQGGGRGQMGRSVPIGMTGPAAPFQIPRVIEIRRPGQTPSRGGGPGGGSGGGRIP